LDPTHHISVGSYPQNSILITPMNEPNMVDTADLGQAYKELVSVFRSQFKMQNRLLIEGNYWTGMHAQVRG
jgi:hypothetical protein